jgi:hypothetical protein
MIKQQIQSPSSHLHLGQINADMQSLALGVAAVWTGAHALILLQPPARFITIRANRMKERTRNAPDILVALLSINTRHVSGESHVSTTQSLEGQDTECEVDWRLPLIAA